jgi:hypothetical protein
MVLDMEPATIVQTYACRWPSKEHAKIIDHQIWLQQQYFNALVQVRQDRRARWRQIADAMPGIAEFSQQLDAVGAEITALYKERADARAEARAMIHFTDIQAKHVERLKDQRKKLYAGRKAAVGANVEQARMVRLLDPAVAELVAELKRIKPEKRANYSKAVKGKIAVLQQEIGDRAPGVAADIDALYISQKQQENALWWMEGGFKAQGLTAGNRALVHKAIAKADSTASGPQWRRWDGEGSVQIEFSNEETKLSVEDLFAGKSGVQVTPPMACAYDRVLPPDTRRTWARRAGVKLRLGTTSVELPMIMHCPLPPDAKIAAVKVVKTVTGGVPRYECQITCITLYRRNENVKSRQLPHWTVAPRGTNGESIGMDAGWRRTNDGLRGYTWADTTGAQGHMMLKASGVTPGASAGARNRENGRMSRNKCQDIHARLKKCDDIRAIRDTYFNVLKKYIAIWITSNDAPTWLIDEAKWITRWRAQAKGARLLRTWSQARFDGDEGIYAVLLAWNARDRHLWQYEEHTRAKAYRQRRELYRLEACRLRRYENVFVENFNLNNVISASPYNRSVVCLSLMRAMIKDMITEKVNAQNTTLIHNACGFKNKKTEFDNASAVFLKCQNKVCGETFDRDLSAARNILDRGLAGLAQSLASTSMPAASTVYARGM